jgi:peptidoglycan/xylan/chitin deacetylase (PgdA/CDA1 family)
MRVKSFRVFATSVVLALGGASGGAAATGVGDQPLHVLRSSLTQDGQQLVWRVKLDRAFSPAALAPEGRSLCLLIERAASGTVTAEVCVVGPRRGSRQPRLVYMRITTVGPGPSHVIAATVGRPSDRELTGMFLPSAIGVGYTALRWQVLSTLRPPACVPPAPNRIGCFTVFPATPAVAKLHTPRLVGCVPSGPSFVANGSRRRRVVALTFDDGPWYDTPQFLRVLERKHVVATFFQIGEQLGTYGRGVDRRMLADGDMIGDHTWNHADVAGDGAFAAGEIARAAAAIRRMTGFRPCLFRAPGGAVSRALISEARRMGFLTIQWDVDPRDWSRPGTDAIYQNVVGNARSGSVILQHDGGGNRSETLAALPREINTLRRRGFRFVTVAELLGLRLIYK